MMTHDEYLREDQAAEEGAHYGDPRRCHRHGCITSSPDGMHDAPCQLCEAEADAETEDPPWTITDDQRKAAIAVEFGAIEAYYPEDECTPDRRRAWNTAATEWERQIDRALAAGSELECRKALELASIEEREWGDDPATQQVRAALGL
jgi:hypothetical protein